MSWIGKTSPRRSLLGLLLFLATAVSSGCFSPPPDNRPIESWDPEKALQGSNLVSDERSGEVLVVLTFSGGGTRAAAFAYGVLQELAATTIEIGGMSRRLFDEVDLVSSVSGGSFTAAYLGLNGDRIFDDFEAVFLRKNVQGRLILEMLRPVNWLRLLRIDRSQLASRYYDRAIFDGATFQDFEHSGGPQIIINATDLASANRFPFSPPIFGMICSDMDSYPVANAVTASSAVPIVFPTVRLHNRAGHCNFEVPERLRATEGELERNPIGGLFREEIAKSYADSEDNQFIHLLDGGISDNLGLRNAVAALSMTGSPRKSMSSIGHDGVQQMLIVVVNAEPTPGERQWQLANRAASSLQVVSGITSSQMHNATRMTIALAKQTFQDWSRQLSRPGHEVDFDLVEVSFAGVEDPDERHFLSGIETSFRLSDEKVDRLIAAARQVLRESPEFEHVLKRLGGGAR